MNTPNNDFYDPHAEEARRLEEAAEALRNGTATEEQMNELTGKH